MTDQALRSMLDCSSSWLAATTDSDIELRRLKLIWTGHHTWLHKLLDFGGFSSSWLAAKIDPEIALLWLDNWLSDKAARSLTTGLVALVTLGHHLPRM